MSFWKLQEQDYDDGYGSDLLGEGEERIRIYALTDLERELLVFERFQARKNKERIFKKKEEQRIERIRFEQAKNITYTDSKLKPVSLSDNYTSSNSGYSGDCYKLLFV